MTAQQNELVPVFMPIDAVNQGNSSLSNELRSEAFVIVESYY